MGICKASLREFHLSETNNGKVNEEGMQYQSSSAER